MDSHYFPGQQNPSRLSLSQRKEFAPNGTDCFLHELIPIKEGCKNENGRDASPESICIPIYLIIFMAPKEIREAY